MLRREDYTYPRSRTRILGRKRAAAASSFNGHGISFCNGRGNRGAWFNGTESNVNKVFLPCSTRQEMIYMVFIVVTMTVPVLVVTAVDPARVIVVVEGL